MSEKDICEECGAEKGEHGSYALECPLYKKDGLKGGYSGYLRFNPIPKPKPTVWRVLPADKLVRVLVDGGWVPNSWGDFEKAGAFTFRNPVWASCGAIVKKNLYGNFFFDGKDYWLDPSWVESVEVEDE